MEKSRLFGKATPFNRISSEGLNEFSNTHRMGITVIRSQKMRTAYNRILLIFSSHAVSPYSLTSAFKSFRSPMVSNTPMMIITTAMALAYPPLYFSKAVWYI